MISSRNHCIEPPCQDTAGDESAIFTDTRSGAVIYTANTKGLDVAEITESCPYNIPRANAGGTIAKCDMCLDRVQNGLQPGQMLELSVTDQSGSILSVDMLCRIDTRDEVAYYEAGGILQYVLDKD